jgi:outer membrane protein assembly factor BamB
MRHPVASSLLVALLAGSAVGADWPNYRGPGHDGVAEATALNQLSVTPAWKVPMGDSFGQIAVSGGKLFLTAERGADEFCVALDAGTGQEAWATRMDKTIKDGNGNGPRSTPAIDGKHVYVLSTYLTLSCLEVETGKEVWKRDLMKEHAASALRWGSASSPVVVEDLVLVTGGGSGKGISAFNKTTGAPVWAKSEEKYTYATPTLATIKGKQQAICFMESGLVSIDPKTGEILWTFAHPKAVATAASPVVGGKEGDIVYCSAGYNIGAAACRITKEGDKWSAAPLWRSDRQAQQTWSTAVHRDGYIYGLYGHNDNNGPLACMDIETGQVKWSQRGFGSQGGLILAGDKLLIQSKGDLVLAPASPEAYKELGRVNVLKAKNWTAPTLANGLVYLRNSSLAGTAAEAVCLKLEK